MRVFTRAVYKEFSKLKKAENSVRSNSAVGVFTKKEKKNKQTNKTKNACVHTLSKFSNIKNPSSMRKWEDEDSRSKINPYNIVFVFIFFFVFVFNKRVH